MSKLNASDIQGFVVRGYNMPFARYCFLRFTAPERARALLAELLPRITTGQLWDRKPQSTVNIAFTHPGFVALGLPLATLVSFPVEFQLGMKARAGILGDTGANAPEHWESLWQEDNVHVWLAVNAVTPESLEAQFQSIKALLDSTNGALLLGTQDAAALQKGGKITTEEHFGYTDGFGNPDYLGVCRKTQPGQGKLSADGKTWLPLATGELLLGYADEAGELPVAPIPHAIRCKWYLHGLSQAAATRRNVPRLSRIIGLLVTVPETTTQKRSSPPSSSAAGATAPRSSSRPIDGPRHRARSSSQHRLPVRRRS